VSILYFAVLIGLKASSLNIHLNIFETSERLVITNSRLDHALDIG
jgi:hypothetical protein